MENAEGKVCTGFSLPYVAKYTSSGTTVTYSQGRRLARGVSVDLDIETFDDNKFYADNVEAENAPAKFRSGTVNLTVDGLLRASENMIMGLPDPTTVTVGQNTTVNMYDYGDDMEIPYVGIGYIARYMSGGEESFVPTILTKTRFAAVTQSAATQEEEIDWQTQELSAALMRDDTEKHNWKRVGADQSTEAAAEAVIKAIFNIT